MNGPPIFAIEVLNFAIITYDVPAERVLRHLPDAYELDTFRGVRRATDLRLDDMLLQSTLQTCRTPLPEAHLQREYL